MENSHAIWGVTWHLKEARITHLPPAEVGSQFSDHGGMQGWVDLLCESGPAGNWTRKSNALLQHQNATRRYLSV